MKNQISDLWSINLRETAIGLAAFVAAALLDLLWSGLNPVIVEFRASGALSFDLFTTKVSIASALDTAYVAASAYILLIFSSGKKKDK